MKIRRNYFEMYLVVDLKCSKCVQISKFLICLNLRKSYGIFKNFYTL